MNRNSIRWRLPFSYAVIALVAAISLGSVMLLVLRSYYAEEERQYLQGNAMVLQPVIVQILESNLPKASLQDQIRGLSFLSQSQIRLLDTNGNVLADSGVPDADQVVAVSGGAPFVGNVMFSVPAVPRKEDTPNQGPVIIYRSEAAPPLPEIGTFETPVAGEKIPGQKRADIILQVNASPYGYGFVSRGEPVSNRRSLQTVGVPLVGSDGQRLGMLEFSRGPSYGADIVRAVSLAWLIASVFAIAIAVLTGWFMSQRVTRPVLALENATREMENGNLSVRVHLEKERQDEFISLANSFNGMAEQVEQTVSTLRAFIADAAHELHSPLTALQANLELASEERDASEQTRYLARAREQSRRLELLVKSLLDLSRIEAAGSDSDFLPVDFGQLVREAGEQYASRAEQSERNFAMDVPDEKMLILGNDAQLRQVLVNLMENALKFTPVDGRVSLTLNSSNNEAYLRITDLGIGIPEEDLPLLFKRFHRARNVSAFPGNGLGLAIVKAIVTRHHGTIKVQSEELKGTTFVVTLPILSV